MQEPGASKSPPLIVGIAGGTGSGKSTVASKVVGSLAAEDVLLIDHDAYYRDHSELSRAERLRLNYDHPDALDNALLLDHLDALRRGEAVDLPQYDFVTHSRLAERRRVVPTPVIVVEGILVLADRRLRERLDVKLFVDTAADIRLLRRIRRDIQFRGRSFNEIRAQYFRTVRPMHIKFVEPSKHHADLIIPEGGYNLVAVDLIINKVRAVVQADQARATARPVTPVGAPGVTATPQAAGAGQA